MKEALESQGKDKLFDLYKAHHEKGFVTVEESAAAFDMTIEEMKQAKVEHPELFDEWNIRVY